MRLSYQKILFEMCYLSFILIAGFSCGYSMGKHGIYYMNKAVIFISESILDVPDGTEFVR